MNMNQIVDLVNNGFVTPEERAYREKKRMGTDAAIRKRNQDYQNRQRMANIMDQSRQNKGR